MKKIVLIDDNRDDSRHKYGADFIDEGLYKDIILNIDKINADCDLDFIKSAACVLLHKTLRDFYEGEFHEDSQKVQNIIRAFPEMGNSIPFVLFSDGDTSDMGDYRQESPNIIYSLNKGAFYSRLDVFLQKYAKTGEIDLRLLAFGNNYETVLVERYASIIFSRIADLDQDEKLNASYVHCEEMRKFVEFAQPKIGKSYENILVDIQLNHVTVRDFKEQVNNILENFQDYGKNYYCWK